ncbi:MAG TPA: imidazole glycerol phosphate synthase subunit HisF [Longimicrobiales bacterium]|nr:imidazole glycerol phosphate synthase subunit HisF [Longimicrobiales bacterium]
MLRKRIIVCLDVLDGRVVKGVSFRGLRDVGDPVALARHYEEQGADEIVFLDISASTEGRRTLLDVVRRTAENLFIPLTVGGGIAEVADVARALRAGADKVAMNTAAVRRPEVITESARLFGSQCIVVSVDAKKEAEAPVRFRVFTHGGREATDLDALDWARRAVEYGAGEILVTSIDQDGRRDGYDLELTGRMVEGVSVPVIASGGAGTSAHVRDAFTRARADAALVAGILHDGVTTVGELKRDLAGAGVPVRLTGSEAA